MASKCGAKIPKFSTKKSQREKEGKRRKEKKERRNDPTYYA